MPPALPITVAVEDVQATDAPGRWRVSWRVANDGQESVHLEQAWLPHGQFRGDGRVPLAETIPGGGAVRLRAEVSAHEPPGTSVENAFLILVVAAGGQRWRVFARMTVVFDEQSVPCPRLEQVTTQSLG